MTEQTVLGREVMAALEIDPRINLHECQIDIQDQDGHIVLAGEVDDIAAKRCAVLTVAGMAGVKSVTDQINVRSGEPMGDGQVRDHARNALLGEPVFGDYRIGVINKGMVEMARANPAASRGEVLVDVQDGRVTLDGIVETPSHRRLAGVLAWWVPGTREVVNRLSVRPPREDNDDELVDAVRLVLEKDPLVTADQITVRSQDFKILLAGVVPRESQKAVAEHDIWYIDGVHGIDNQLQAPKTIP